MDRLPVSLPSVNTLARETVYLPVDGAPGHVAKGAMGYVAILTYPDRLKARDHLIVAFESAVFRELVPPEHWKKLPRYLRRMAPDRIEGVIADALRLINGQRLHAARALQQLIMAAWPGGSVQAFGVGVSDLFDAITAMNESQRQLYRTGYIAIERCRIETPDQRFRGQFAYLEIRILGLLKPRV